MKEKVIGFPFAQRGNIQAESISAIALMKDTPKDSASNGFCLVGVDASHALFEKVEATLFAFIRVAPRERLSSLVFRNKGREFFLWVKLDPLW